MLSGQYNGSCSNYHCRAAQVEEQCWATVGVREDTSAWEWSLKLKVSWWSFTSPNLDINTPLSSSKALKKNPEWLMCCCRDVVCDDSSEFWEVNELVVGSIQGSYFVLECLLSPMKRQVQSVYVSGDVSQRDHCNNNDNNNTFYL